MSEQILERPMQIPSEEIFNEEDRFVKGWGSVEIIDKDGEMLPMSEFKKVMPIVMKRGGNINDRHSNRHVGKILNYEFKMKETPEGPKEGVYLTYQIFKDYDIDDMVWEGIKQGIYKGLSFGGMNKTLDYSFKDREFSKILREISGFEFSTVPEMGNQESVNDQVNYFAKSEKEKEHEEYKGDDPFLKNYYEVKKPFAGFKDFDACVRSASDKDDPQAYCAAIRQQVEKLESGNKNQEIAQKEKDYNLPQINEKSDKFLNNKFHHKSMNEPVGKKDTKKEGEEVPENNSLEERLARLEQAVAAIMEQKKAEHGDEDDEEKKKQPEDEDEDKKKPKDEDVDKEAQDVKLPKDTAEKIQDQDAKDPAGDEETDKVKFVEKDNVQKIVAKEVEKGMNEIRKSLKVPGATTPGINEDSFINKQEASQPSTWKEANAELKKRLGR